jgi:hypothetical protein
MNYYVTSIIHLSLEDYYNAGLTPEHAKTVIELMNDPGSSGLKLQCRNQGINHNWNVITGLTDPEHISWLVGRICVNLDMALENGPPVTAE